VHWRNHLKFPEDAKLSNEARDLICRLLCDVDHRIGSAGADQIKVAPVTGFFLTYSSCLVYCVSCHVY
jgi:hypothetical protein